MFKYFFIYIVIETIISVNISHNIGAIYTILEIFISGFLGFFLMSFYRLNLFNDLRVLKDRNELEKMGVIYIYKLIGIVFLILPGFLTDGLGLLMQFGTPCAYIHKKLFAKHGKDRYNSDSEQIIDVEDFTTITENKKEDYKD